MEVAIEASTDRITFKRLRPLSKGGRKDSSFQIIQKATNMLKPMKKARPVLKLEYRLAILMFILMFPNNSQPNCDDNRSYCPHQCLLSGNRIKSISQN